MSDACPVTVSVETGDFDVAADTARLCGGRHDIGAVASFIGLCRDEAGQLDALELEHYPGMAEDELKRIAGEAAARWPLLGVVIRHRYGVIAPGAQIVAVICASSHRAAALAATDFIMDFLKSRAPFWKKEHGRRGGDKGWVDARDADEAALARWHQG
ncbi:MAG: molybdenum cofactor biosynthesis protein MoaE [Hyphomicrobiales bacterium]|nr:molybdenum cofactor biosynthesis protein MoaE [Hyphomicrobiales bacterium]